MPPRNSPEGEQREEIAQTRWALRWVVERTLSWIDQNRRRGRDYNSFVRAARRWCMLP